MMEFVNGKDDIPYMKWKIKAMFQTTNHLMLLPGEPDLQRVVQRDLGHQGGHGLWSSACPSPPKAASISRQLFTGSVANHLCVCGWAVAGKRQQKR